MTDWKFEPEDFRVDNVHEWIGKAPRVYCAKGYGHYDSWSENMSDLDDRHTHTARLICIEEIK